MITAVTYSDKVCTDVPLEELVELNNTMISKPEDAWKAYMAVVRPLRKPGRTPLRTRRPNIAAVAGDALRRDGPQIAKLFGDAAVTADPGYVPGSFVFTRGGDDDDEGARHPRGRRGEGGGWLCRTSESATKWWVLTAAGAVFVSLGASARSMQARRAPSRPRSLLIPPSPGRVTTRLRPRPKRRPWAKPARPVEPFIGSASGPAGAAGA